jgi:hypothetical protein
MVQDNNEQIPEAPHRLGMVRAEWFTCRCCGQRAPIERLTKEGPFDFQMWIQEYGGKRALTPEDREARRGRRFPRGSAPGNMIWSPTEIMKKYQDAFDKRISDINGGSESPSPGKPVRPKPPTKSPTKTPSFDIEELKSRLNGIMNEEKKAQSIKALEKTLAGVDEDKVDISDLEEAIQQYKDVTREGLTPEEYNDEKQTAFENIQEQIEALEPTEDDEE